MVCLLFEEQTVPDYGHSIQKARSPHSSSTYHSISSESQDCFGSKLQNFALQNSVTSLLNSDHQPNNNVSECLFVQHPGANDLEMLKWQYTVHQQARFDLNEFSIGKPVESLQDGRDLFVICI